ncbi:hypothetical protein [Azospirillum sp. SYSU D00513]|uniref:hypothetical protein n=1 Tax=Azospirillum sp. SYSU D00513 TaxID=2812561 RepID=UPI001A96B49E|nr:hypothetical protein [Azospirillum sp. SYSU D00513]
MSRTRRFMMGVRCRSVSRSFAVTWSTRSSASCTPAPASQEPKRLYSDEELWSAPPDTKITNRPVVDSLDRGEDFFTTMRASLAPNLED